MVFVLIIRRRISSTLAKFYGGVVACRIRRIFDIKVEGLEIGSEKVIIARRLMYNRANIMHGTGGSIRTDN